MEYKNFINLETGISFHYPSNWSEQVEPKNTFLFYDEQLGSFRFTPIIIEKTLDKISFLNKKFEERQDFSAEWLVFNHRRFLYYREVDLDESNTYTEYYYTFFKKWLFVFSYSFDISLQSTESIKNEKEEVFKILSCLVED